MQITMLTIVIDNDFDNSGNGDDDDDWEFNHRLTQERACLRIRD